MASSILENSTMVVQSSSRICCDPFNTSEDENEDVLKGVKDRNKEKFDDNCNEGAEAVDFMSIVVHRTRGRS